MSAIMALLAGSKRDPRALDTERRMVMNQMSLWNRNAVNRKRKIRPRSPMEANITCLRPILSASSPPTIWPKAPATAMTRNTMPTSPMDRARSRLRWMARKGSTMEKPVVDMIRPPQSSQTLRSSPLREPPFSMLALRWERGHRLHHTFR
ncbi:MAG: hypothetical protein A4E31_00912 [Methanomassiliicoccales archaeon PtaU1.Bin030]|nr:MAG: hypothetical protein A4E31_00912 [Methanomassiliicoccales archaeon PtaU1.Bin030]